VVEVLAATGIVRADGLEVTVLHGADPDVPPRRRDDQRLATGDIGCAEAPAVLVEIDEPAPMPTSRPARGVRSYTTQTPRHAAPVPACHLFETSPQGVLLRGRRLIIMTDG
jgi:hypothetical protein